MNGLGRIFDALPNMAIRLGEMENRALAERLDEVPIEAPIYVSGLARAGSTILLERLAAQEGIASHRYRDYPPVLAPWLWNDFLSRVPRRAERPHERAHKDGIMVTSESPEAFEEMVWMAFFDDIHNPRRSNVLDATTSNRRFEAFYRNHIRKLLLIRDADRYLAKGNYNVTRLEYLQSLFEDARFIVPIRDPVWHVASLMKQHDLFCRNQEGNPRARRHLSRIGHFEFGVDRTPINAGELGTVALVTRLWRDGREVEGWAHYWAHIYGHVAERLTANSDLRAATVVLRYEDFCRQPHDMLTVVFEHCGLPSDGETIAAAAAGIGFPGYYRPDFSDDEVNAIRRITRNVAAQFGYLGGPD